ncbi:MAG: ribonuclease H family protein [Desulfotomaculaceae bacterium]|nr:ribonuclease H family protein [Desulfotomaculaceae bacterium]
MAKKYYAVKQGRKTGIFNSWLECKEQVEGYKNASYKGFATIKEAQNYLELENGFRRLQSTENNKPSRTLVAYVDGSFSENQNMYSYGCVLSGDETKTISGIGNNPDIVAMRNVAGELLGAVEAIKWAYENNYKSIVIYHDYQGIAKWATGEWEAKKEGTKKYVEFINRYKNLLDIKFNKVEAHSGNTYNEQADQIAREALAKVFNNIDGNHGSA